MDPALPLKIVIALVCLGANAFFVAAEFALVKVRRTRVRELAASGDRLARSVERSVENLDRSISGCQLGITLASLGLGWIGEPAVAEPLSHLFSTLPGAWSTFLTHGTAVAVAFLFITFLHIVLGELAPKTAALVRPEMVSRAVAMPLNAFNFVTGPAVWFLNGTANLIVDLLGLDRTGVTEGHVHSPEEIQMLLEQSLQGGTVEQDEEAMIHGVFELTRTVAREVMTPRTDIVAVPVDASVDEVLATSSESGYSRFPVYRGSLDEVVGVLLIKDVLPWIQEPPEDPFDAEALARDAIFVPDTKPVDDLLAELRRQKVHMAVVVDEFGGTDGIVTLEDLVEEIVGDIYDEHDVARAEVRVDGEGRILVAGTASLSDLAERFELEGVDTLDYDTVAGYVMGELGHIPEDGERVALDGAQLEVLETRDRRVARLELHLPEEEDEEREEAPAAGEEPEGGTAGS